MIGSLVKNVIGSRNSRELKRIQRIVNKINAFTDEIKALSSEDFGARSDNLRQRYAESNDLDALLPEAFALVREVADRVNDTRPFDVQLSGGVVLHEGNIAEMRTGEGKTLVATLPAYLNALTGKGVHIVTVNDYLARRDAEWMGPIFETLGVSVGVIQSNQDAEDKKRAYQADITYGTNNEFGFDYLRDNLMAFRPQDRMQRGLNFAIVDEVDSILIDEARTPLIITGPAEDSTELYQHINKIAPRLKRQDKVEDDLPAILGGEKAEDTGDYFVDEENRSVELTDRGHQTVERLLKNQKLLTEDDSLYDEQNLGLLHHVTAALKAHYLYKRDVDYMVQGNEVVIIDEHTGRAMHGRRWSEGIHQAVEAKEGLIVQRETQTMASTTYQNYFRLYDRLSGMTGTADTEAFEFKQTYGMEVIVVPTNMPMIRDDRNDLIFLTLDEKYDAIVEDINDCKERGQPALVGTTSIESSERLSRELKQRKIPHSVLNAKQHEREADIVAQAGRPGAVTIATNMAGRGTDIVLGGNWLVEVEQLGESPSRADVDEIKSEWQKRHDQVIEAGGLHIVGTERHESRRIDNQLRGRSGRQGDPGSSRFYLSMEDNLLRLFATPRWQQMIQAMGMEKGQAIEAKMVNNAIEKAQRKVEGRNFDIRKNLLEFDDVANDQRTMIYQQRNELMSANDIKDMIIEMRKTVVEDEISSFIPPQSIPEQWDIDGLEQSLPRAFGINPPIRSWLDGDEVEGVDDLIDRVEQEIATSYETKRAEWVSQGIGVDAVEHQIMLSILDRKWKEHLAKMDHLRQGIHLRAYAQKQPKQEYKRESFELFQEMLHEIQFSMVQTLSLAQLKQGSDQEDVIRRRREAARRLQYRHDSLDQPQEEDNGDTVQVQPFKRSDRKVGRNEACPCGSGKKYKHCHGRAT